MRVLFLDDNLNRAKLAIETFKNDDLFLSPSASHAVSTLEECVDTSPWDLVMLDHDLGGEENAWQEGKEPTGMVVVDWIVEHRPAIKRIVIHSWNVPAAERMVSKLIFSGYSAVRKPFAIMQ